MKEELSTGNEDATAETVRIHESALILFFDVLPNVLMYQILWSPPSDAIV